LEKKKNVLQLWHMPVLLKGNLMTFCLRPQVNSWPSRQHIVRGRMGSFHDYKNKRKRQVTRNNWKQCKFFD
jgi:hypothetical protein